MAVKKVKKKHRIYANMLLKEEYSSRHPCIDDCYNIRKRHLVYYPEVY